MVSNGISLWLLIWAPGDGGGWGVVGVVKCSVLGRGGGSVEEEKAGACRALHSSRQHQPASREERGSHRQVGRR